MDLARTFLRQTANLGAHTLLAGCALLTSGCGPDAPSSTQSAASASAESGPVSTPELLPAEAVSSAPAVRLRVDRAPVFLIFKDSLYLGEPTHFEVEAAPEDQGLRMVMGTTTFDALGLLAFDLDLPQRDRLQIEDRDWQVLGAEPTQITVGEGPPQVLTGLKLELVRRLGASKIAVTATLFVGVLGGEAFFEAYRKGRESAFESWSADRFTAWICAELDAQFPDRGYTVEGPLRLRRGEREAFVGLNNFYTHFALSPTRTHRLAELARVVQLEDVAYGPADKTVNPDQLLASIKGPDYIQNITELEDASIDHRFVHEPFVHDLRVVYVVDRPDTMVNLTTDVLDRLDVDPDELRALVARNLWAAHDTIRVHGDPSEGPIMITCGGNYEASLMLVPRFWAALAPMLDGAPVVAVPARSLLLVCGSDDLAGIEALRERAAGAAELPYPISAELFTRRDGRWHVLPKDIGTPIGEA